MAYENNGFRSYWKLLSKTTAFPDQSLTSKVLNGFQTAIKLIQLILKDAGIELVFLLIFWLIVTKMGQGRDLIVSLFEPDSIYHRDRIFFTTLSTISFSLSMWVIPAFLFQKRDDANKSRKKRSVFEQHLFFVHRILPLIPFWLMASVLFNGEGTGKLFIGLSLLQLGILFLFNEKVKGKARWLYAFVVLGLLAVAVTWFSIIYRVQYTEAKVMLAVIFYLLAFLMHFVYSLMDNWLVDQHRLKAANPNPSGFRRYNINSWLYITLIILHTIVVVLIFYPSREFEIAPESILLYLFSLYIFIIDLAVYYVNVSAKRRFVASLLILLIIVAYTFSSRFQLTLDHYTVDPIRGSSVLNGMERNTFEDRYQVLKKEIDSNTSGMPYPIVLISGEGGGSRAGMWFSQNLINFDYYTQGAFRKHIFSMSTVSGSSVGAGTVYAFWELTGGENGVDKKWLAFPSRVYNNNFVGSSISGLLLTDFAATLIPFSTTTVDRNTILQQEEAYHTQRAYREVVEGKDLSRHTDIPAETWILNQDFMNFFYTRDSGKLHFRKDRPLAFINTCRSNDGRRGIFAPVKLGNDYFNDAIDIAGYLYDEEVCDHNGKSICRSNKMNISLGQVCNYSELFPLFSAPAYIDSLGSFVDGGYHENSGLKTTLDVYQKLKEMLKVDTSLHKKYQIYIVYLKNGSEEKELYNAQKSEVPLLQPLKALYSQPFQGSASYFEERARFTDRKDSSALQFIEVKLDNRMMITDAKSPFKDPDRKEIETEILNDLNTGLDTTKKEATLNFPLARWLSNSVIRRMYMDASDFQDGKILGLLNNINTINKKTVPSLEVFKK